MRLPGLLLCGMLIFSAGFNSLTTLALITSLDQHLGQLYPEPLKGCRNRQVEINSRCLGVKWQEAHFSQHFREGYDECQHHHDCKE